MYIFPDHNSENDVQNVRRDSGLEIIDLDKVKQSRSNNEDCEIDVLVL
jgi:hypothetical protein